MNNRIIRTCLVPVSAVLALLALSIPRAQTCVQLPSGAVSWWPGDGNAEDIVGDNDGTLENGATLAPGQVGQAFRFVGDLSKVQVSSVTSIEVQQFTVGAWVLAGSTGYRDDVLGGVIVSKDIGNTYSPPFVSWSLVGLGNTNRYHVDIGFTDGSIHLLPSTHTFAFNTFTHVAGTWDGSSLKLYVNGNLEGMLNVGPKTISYSGEPLTIGEHNMTPVARRGFDGLIDEVEFYNRALSACEIRAIYSAGAAGTCKGDSDGDGALDFQDNCPLTPNPAQGNADADMAGDACDCAPADPSAFAAPIEIAPLRLGLDGNKDYLDWCSTQFVAGARLYDVSRGGGGEFPVGTGASELCVASGITEPMTTDSEVPVDGKGFWYLVRGRNACGIGTYGFRSDGAERMTSACP